MIKVYSEALGKSIATDRIIGYHKGIQPGPTLIFIAGIHGNEPAGVFAFKKVSVALETNNIEITGSIYGIAGNLSALEMGTRYHKEDLNRIWTRDKLKHVLGNASNDSTKDQLEQISIYTTIQKILTTEHGPFYFFDLHTTSSKTTPFLTVNDSLLNRKFTMQYPIKMILGIEEYLNGALLSYINELGYVSFGFEGGQHDDPASIKNHISFIYLTMVYTGCVDKTAIQFDLHYNSLLASLETPNAIYEIFCQHHIKPGDDFYMKPGFINFQKIHQGQEIATSNDSTIVAVSNGRIFMPLYQNQGDDGFFIIRKTPKFFLQFSAILRKIRFDHILPILPGVRWKSHKKDSLTIDLKVAKFFTKQFFHLIGYRSKQIDKTHLIVSNREAASRKDDYKNAIWNSG